MIPATILRPTRAKPITTGSRLKIEVAVSASHGSWNSPIISRKPTGQVRVRSDEVSSRANKTSFQAVMAVRVPVAASHGSTRGIEIRHIAPMREQPSMRAAFTKSGGRESKNPFINQIVAGKVKVVYARVNPM